MSEPEILRRLAEHVKLIAPIVSKGNVRHYCKGCGDACLIDVWAITLGMCGPCCVRIAAALVQAAERGEG